MQQINKKTHMSKCDVNKVACNFNKIALQHGYSPVNLMHIFRTSLPKNTSGGLPMSFLVNKSKRLHPISETKFNIVHLK